MSSQPIDPKSLIAAPAAAGPSEVVATHRYREAYERMRPRYMAMPAEEILAPNLDVPVAAVQVIGCGGKIAVHAEAASEFPGYDGCFETLESAALGAAHAHNLAMAASAAAPIPALVDELTVTRDNLTTDIGAAVKRGLISGDALKGLRGTRGFANLAFDVMTACTVARENWPVLEGRSAITTAELDRAEELADRLAAAVGLKEQGALIDSQSTDMRNRAFTTFVKTYDMVRKYISFLRWIEGDVDEIAPSLYAQRGAGRRRPSEDDTLVSPAPVPGPAPAPGSAPVLGPTPVSPAAPVVPSPSNGPAAPAPTPVVANGSAPIVTAHLVGTPDDEPFKR